MSDLAPSVLVFREVDYRSTSPLYADLRGCSIDLLRSELFLVGIIDSAQRYPVCDLAEGLITPSRGTVLFLGRDWQKMSPFEQTTARSRIGRVFEDQAWISNLTVLENVTLPQRHHTRRSTADILEEATRLARQVGLDGIPTERPHVVRREVLQKAQWVRAFLGDPALLLLEQPEKDVPPDHVPALIKLVSEARERGAAVVWITHDAEVWKTKALKPARRCRIELGRWVAEPEGP